MGSTNNDYVTIHYQGNGTLVWAQTYNGPGNGTDEACAMIHDGDDIVVTGKSTGSGSGLDVCTISMVKSSGSVNWTMRINESGSSGDYGYSLCRDEMGNIIVAGNSLISSSYGNTCYKFNQASKNYLAIRLHLEMLAFGAVAIANDTMSKRILYDIASLLVDSVYQVNWKRYLSKCDLHSSQPRTLIRQGIVAEYALSSQINWENVLNLRVFDGNKRIAPMIFVPAFEKFTRSAFISTSLVTAFAHGELDFPISSLPDHDGLYETDFESTPTLTLVATIGFWWQKNAPRLLYCYADRVNPNGNTCNHCGTFVPLDGLSLGNFCTNGALNFEVGIQIGYDYGGSCNPPTGDIEKCLTVYDYATGLGLTFPYFAILQQMPGFEYYRLIGTGDYQRIEKVPYGLYDDNTQAYGMSLTLCQEWNTLNSLNTAALTQDFGIAQGGIFRISRPGTGQRPVYFTLPYTQHLRYIGYPDIQIAYGTDFLQSPCTDGREEVEEDYFDVGSPILNSSQTVFGWTANQSADVFMTTDFQTINSYWSDNAIVVGFNTTAHLVTPGNFTTFYAVSSPVPCNPLTYNLASTTPVCTLQVLSDETYEVHQNLFGTPTPTYAAGTNFLVHVRAKYSNGESIDECQQVTLVTGSTGIKNVAVEIRGGINDYSSTVINYKVDVYLMN